MPPYTLIQGEDYMVKMESPNRKGLWKEFREADVEAAKVNGWKELVKSKPKAKKSKGAK